MYIAEMVILLKTYLVMRFPAYIQFMIILELTEEVIIRSIDCSHTHLIIIYVNLELIRTHFKNYSLCYDYQIHQRFIFFIGSG